MRASSSVAVAMAAGVLIAVFAACSSASGVMARKPPHHHHQPHAFWIEGLLAASMTAFNADGSLNLTAIPLQAAALKRDGVSYVFLGGTTSECLSLTTHERKLIVETWVPLLAANGLQMIVHVGNDALVEAVDLAKHAVAHGAVAIAAFPPVYFKPASSAALLATMGTIAAAVPNTPFIYYHFPAMTGTLANGGLVQFVQAAAAQIPNFHGVKYTDDNMLEVGTIVRWRDANNRAYQILMGKDELLADALLTGVNAFVGSTYNYAAPLYNRMINAWNSGNITGVQLEQSRAQSFINVFSAHNAGDNIRGNKPVMTLATGIDMGPPRLPQMAMPPAEVEQLNDQLQAIGFFSWSQ